MDYSKFWILPGITMLALTACSDDKLAVKTDAKSHPLPLVATYAFDTKAPIKTLAFVPNDTAPWLGRLILMTDAGHLISTTIEGDDFVSVSQKTYTDVFGLSRSKSAGIVVAINETGGLEAFIESDDKGGFSAMTYSGASLHAKSFCRFASPDQGTLRIMDTNGKVHNLSFTAKGNVIEQKIDITSPDANCATNANFVYGSNDSAYIVTNINGSAHLNVDGEQPGYTLNIADGLSIRGLDKTSNIIATRKNYGGAAFKDGVVAFIDSNEPRIVFLSLDYLASKAAEAP